MLAPTRPAPNVLSLALADVGGLLLIVCAFLPWITLNLLGTSFSINGLGQVSDKQLGDNSTTGDGIIAIVLGIVLLLSAGLGFILKRGWAGRIAQVFGVLATLFMLYELINIGNSLKDPIFQSGGASTGLGVYLGLLGAIIALVGGVLALVQQRRAR